jgi:hypothetical protein
MEQALAVQIGFPMGFFLLAALVNTGSFEAKLEIEKRRLEQTVFPQKLHQSSFLTSTNFECSPQVQKITSCKQLA